MRDRREIGQIIHVSSLRHTPARRRMWRGGRWGVGKKKKKNTSESEQGRKRTKVFPPLSPTLFIPVVAPFSVLRPIVYDERPRHGEDLTYFWPSMSLYNGQELTDHKRYSAI